MFNINSIKEYQLGITTHCNAACPQCPRNILGGKINPKMPLCHLNPEVIKNTFQTDLVKNIRQIFFCGSYGDPITHPNFLDIVEDFRSKSQKLYIYIHTNGSAHNEDWWMSLAEIIGVNGRVDFNIDGLQDTNHVYRKNTNFKKIIDNASAYIRMGGIAEWNYIVFKHNQHQIDQAKQQSKMVGFSKINFRKTGRFLDQSKMEELDQWPVNNKKGELQYYLEPTTLDSEKNRSINNLQIMKKQYGDNLYNYFDSTTIKCDSCVGQKVTITAEGLVLPCNFFEHNLYDMRFDDPNITPSSNKLHTVDGINQVKNFIDSHDPSSLNINNHTLDEIFQNPFWTDLVDSWNKNLDNGRIFECAFTCGKKLSKVWDQHEITMDKRFLITGGTRGLGKHLKEQYNGDDVSRTSAKLNIVTQKDIEKIAMDSLNYDVFINNAFDGPPHEPWANFGQVNLLHEIYKQWKDNNKKGYIINIGSVAANHVVAPDPMFETYRVAKSALQHASKQITQAFKQNLVGFKCTLISPDRIDNETTRKRSNWTGNGIVMDDIRKAIDWCLSCADHTVVDEITIYCNLLHDVQSKNNSV